MSVLTKYLKIFAWCFFFRIHLSIAGRFAYLHNRLSHRKKSCCAVLLPHCHFHIKHGNNTTVRLWQSVAAEKTIEKKKIHNHIWICVLYFGNSYAISNGEREFSIDVMRMCAYQRRIDTFGVCVCVTLTKQSL